MILNAKIESTSLGFHDGFGSIPTAWIQVGDGSWGQGFGGYGFGGVYTHDFIYGVLNALEAPSWEDLKGMHCRIERSSRDRIVRIGHILKDKWYDPAVAP